MTKFEADVDGYKRIKEIDMWQSIMLDRISEMVQKLPDAAAADDVDLNM